MNAGLNLPCAQLFRFDQNQGPAPAMEPVAPESHDSSSAIFCRDAWGREVGQATVSVTWPATRYGELNVAITENEAIGSCATASGVGW